MQAVVLVGGLGSRLRAAVADRPKALAVVGELLLSLTSCCWRCVTRECDGSCSRPAIAAVSFHTHLPAWRALGLEIELSREAAPLGTGGRPGWRSTGSRRIGCSC